MASRLLASLISTSQRQQATPPSTYGACVAGWLLLLDRQTRFQTVNGRWWSPAGGRGRGTCARVQGRGHEPGGGAASPRVGVGPWAWGRGCEPRSRGSLGGSGRGPGAAVQAYSGSAPCCLAPDFYSVQFSRSVVPDSATPWTAARQASLSITSSRTSTALWQTDVFRFELRVH